MRNDRIEAQRVQRILMILIAGAWAVAGPAWAQPVVHNLRVGEHPEWTRVVVDLSESTVHDVVQSEGEDRVVIDLPGVQWREDIGSRAATGIPGQGLVARLLRQPRPSGLGSRLILELRRPAAIWRTFILPPDAGRSYRLVIDLKPMETAGAQKPADPEAAEDKISEAEPEQPSQTEKPIPTDSQPQETEPPSQPRDTAKKEPEGTESARGDQRGAPPLAGGPPPVSLDGPSQQWSGKVEGEVRLFPQDVPGKGEADVSLAAEIKFEEAWDNGTHAITAVPFVRLDAQDDARTHVDIRELKWIGSFNDWEIRVGAERVFWGVAESVHLVNIINQIDGVEDIDEEDFLGQPMASVSWRGSWGTLTGFVLPYFRERRFLEPDGRPGGMRVAEDRALYESDDEQWHIDWALRYAHAFGPFDIGIGHFSGTARDPLMISDTLDGEPVMIPFYDLIDQTSLDLQGTFGPLLLKFEGISVDGRGERYHAAVGGFEYTIFGIGGGNSDLGILAEYLWDERGEAGPSPFEDDLFLGLRWAANNTPGTQVLAGAIFDTDTSTKVVNIEASQRLWQDWRLSLDARLFLDVQPQDPLNFLRRDDFLQLRLGRYF